MARIRPSANLRKQPLTYRIRNRQSGCFACPASETHAVVAKMKVSVSPLEAMVLVQGLSKPVSIAGTILIFKVLRLTKPLMC